MRKIITWIVSLFGYEYKEIMTITKIGNVHSIDFVKHPVDLYTSGMGLSFNIPTEGYIKQWKIIKRR